MKNSIKIYENNLYKFVYREVENQEIKTDHVNTEKISSICFLLVQEKNV